MRTALRWLVVAAAVVFAVAAAAGWYVVERQSAQLADARAANRAGTIRSIDLNRQVTTLQQRLAAAEAQLASTAQQLVAARKPPPPPPEPTAGQRQLDAAQARLTAAQAALTKADAATNDAGSAKPATPPPAPSKPPSSPPSRPLPVGTSGITPTTAPGPAPALPSPGLPAGSSAHAHLVAAEQAIRGSRLGEAQAALEQAEVMMLNGTQLQPPRTLGGHPGVTAIEQALDRLGANDPEGALRSIEQATAAYAGP